MKNHFQNWEKKETRKSSWVNASTPSLVQSGIGGTILGYPPSWAGRGGLHYKIIEGCFVAFWFLKTPFTVLKVCAELIGFMICRSALFQISCNSDQRSCSSLCGLVKYSPFLKLRSLIPPLSDICPIYGKQSNSSCLLRFYGSDEKLDWFLSGKVNRPLVPLVTGKEGS